MPKYLVIYVNNEINFNVDLDRVSNNRWLTIANNSDCKIPIYNSRIKLYNRWILPETLSLIYVILKLLIQLESFLSDDYNFSYSNLNIKQEDFKNKHDYVSSYLEDYFNNVLIKNT